MSPEKRCGDRTGYCPISSWQIEGEKVKQQIFFSWASKLLQVMTAAMELKVHAPWKESYDKTRQCSKKQRDHFPDKDPHSQSFGFSSSYVQM